MADTLFGATTAPIHPKDAKYLARRQYILEEVRAKRMTREHLETNLKSMLNTPLDKEQRLAYQEETRKIMPDLYREVAKLADTTQDPRLITLKGILDSTSGTTGNVLIRQDFDPILHMKRVA